jgi:antitoxin ParD1/3/4
MNISLTPELEALIQAKVKSGLYHSASEVVREALRLLKEHDELRRIRLAELRREIQIGLDQVERGEVVPFDIEEIKAEARQRREGQG